MQQEQLDEIIYAAISELNQGRSSDEQIPSSESTALYGKQSPLDSVDLVNLLVTIEEGLEDEFGISFMIANEKAMSMQHSPFRTVKTLREYLQQELSS